MATVAIGNAKNAGILAARILGATDDAVRCRMEEYMARLEAEVTEKIELMKKDGWESYLEAYEKKK